MGKTSLSLALDESARISTLSLIVYGVGVALAVLIVGILAINGVFTPEPGFQGKCFVKAPFGCSEFGVNKDGVRIKIINGAGSAVDINKINISGCGENADGWKNISDGEIADIFVSCPAGKRGEKFDGNVEITYILSGDDVEKVVSGEIESEITNIAGGGGGGSSGGGSSGGGGGSGGSPPSSVCGNNITESGEVCDDGNILNGDGCNSSCQVEVGGVCTNGQTQPCSNQVGVCSGSFETCTGSSWSGCGVSEYGANLNYQSTESSCSDELDNDCDGDTDGSDSGCSSGGSVITAFATANYASFVAPCAVFFDATESTHSTLDSVKEFLFMDYMWEFNDPYCTNQVWNASGKSKCSDRGPVAGHVYETPGTYEATLYVSYDGETDTAVTSQITVTNPDTVYNGANTICLRADNSPDTWDGCPNGANQITNSDLDTAMGTTPTGNQRWLL